METLTFQKNPTPSVQDDRGGVWYRLPPHPGPPGKFEPLKGQYTLPYQ